MALECSPCFFFPSLNLSLSLARASFPKRGHRHFFSQGEALINVPIRLSLEQ